MDSEIGFRRNFMVLKLLESRTEGVTRNQNVDQLESKLGEIQKKSDVFRANLQSGTD